MKIVVFGRGAKDPLSPREFAVKAKTAKDFPDGSIKTRLMRNFRQTDQDVKPRFENIQKHFPAESVGPSRSAAFPAAGAESA